MESWIVCMEIERLMVAFTDDAQPPPSDSGWPRSTVHMDYVQSRLGLPCFPGL